MLAPSSSGHRVIRRPVFMSVEAKGLRSAYTPMPFGPCGYTQFKKDTDRSVAISMMISVCATKHAQQMRLVIFVRVVPHVTGGNICFKRV